MKKSKIKNILLSIIIVILVLLSGYLLYDKFFNTNNNIGDNKDDKVSNNKNVLNIYGSEYGSLKFACQGKRTSCNKIIATIEVNNKNANIIYIWNNYVLYFDDKMKIYDINNRETKELDIDISEKEINEISYLNNDAYYLENGFIFSYSNSDDNSKKQEYYYDVKNNRKLFSEYSLLTQVRNANYLSSAYSNRYIQGLKDGIYYLLDVETGKSVLNRKPDEGYESVGFEVIQGCGENDVLFSSYLQEMVSLPYNYIIYNKDGKVIDKLDKDEIYIADNCQNGSDVFIYKRDHVYDIEGNLRK